MKAGQSEFTVESWEHVQQVLFENSWRPRIKRYRSSFAFRGVANASYTDLPTSLQRLGGRSARNESGILRNFIKYAYQQGPDPTNTWEWLALAQHHGLPTRLLDWTWSPYVALHFATDKDFDKPGLVWCIDFQEAMRFLPKRLRDAIRREGATLCTVSMLQDVAPGLSALDRLKPRNPFLLFFEPPSLDSRIVNQYGLFSVMSDAGVMMDEWLVRKKSLYRKIIIPAELKWEIRDKLDQANITERVLFPGLDGLASWLKRYYSPGPGKASG